MLRVTQRGEGERRICRDTSDGVKNARTEGREKVGCDCEDGDEWREWQGYLGVESMLNFFGWRLYHVFYIRIRRERGEKGKEGKKNESVDRLDRKLCRSCTIFSEMKFVLKSHFRCKPFPVKRMEGITHVAKHTSNGWCERAIIINWIGPIFVD